MITETEITATPSSWGKGEGSPTRVQEKKRVLQQKEGRELVRLVKKGKKVLKQLRSIRNFTSGNEMLHRRESGFKSRMPSPGRGKS